MVSCFTPNIFWRVAVVAFSLTFAAAAMADTRAMLQVGVKGRAGVDRNRLILFNTMSDGRAIMLALSCRVKDDNYQAIAAGVDFGVGDKWDIAGEDVTIALDNNEPVVRRMLAYQDMLALNGQEAIDVFKKVLAANNVIFTAPGNVIARFELKDVTEHVRRFRPLCDLE